MNKRFWLKESTQTIIDLRKANAQMLWMKKKTIPNVFLLHNRYSTSVTRTFKLRSCVNGSICFLYTRNSFQKERVTSKERDASKVYKINILLKTILINMPHSKILPSHPYVPVENVVFINSSHVLLVNVSAYDVRVPNAVVDSVLGWQFARVLIFELENDDQNFPRPQRRLLICAKINSCSVYLLVRGRRRYGKLHPISEKIRAVYFLTLRMLRAFALPLSAQNVIDNGWSK